MRIYTAVFFRRRVRTLSLVQEGGKQFWRILPTSHFKEHGFPLNSLFVVDATRGEAAWFNFGPKADVYIRRVWQKAS